MRAPVSVVVVARDEVSMIDGCLGRLGFAEEVIVGVDSRTRDATAERAAAWGAQVVALSGSTFSELKGAAIALASQPWTMVVDADERVTAPLAEEIGTVLANPTCGAYGIPIDNYFYGHRIRHPLWAERPIRLFRTGSARYVGDLHERLVFEGGQPTTGAMVHGLAHFSHRSILDNLRKTHDWADLQAAEMLRAGAPQVTARSLARAIGTPLARAVAKRVYRDGMPGVIDAAYQAFSMFAVHARLWELQRSPSVEELYRLLEEETR